MGLSNRDQNQGIFTLIGHIGRKMISNLQTGCCALFLSLLLRFVLLRKESFSYDVDMYWMGVEKNKLKLGTNANAKKGMDDN